jgi:hypothetical protein
MFPLISIILLYYNVLSVFIFIFIFRNVLISILIYFDKKG